ncbi:2-octaprenyl-6-methoxyphenyl hydroxylase [Palleronia sediminis]|uniref:2-octaprenyl-6-methoxyphenyl hydroxylase n=1 Tax=Palleronia sediminis TaxID=2547833 RepID=A0A4V3B998_9RHOB|nr:FAD-dependent monooxygenase [Palleronia sediminis]TDL78379.1 2-octaprenyl-6-methoxyphenyl hydroxylase [Palleronia sediminis]
MDTDVIISGGGLNGLTLALALSHGGLRVSLADPSPLTAETADFDGRSYALAAASCNLLRAIGVWGALAERAQPILGIKVSDGRAGEGPSPLHLAFDHAELEEGPMGHMVEDRHLRPVLVAAARAAERVTLLPGRSVEDHTPDATGVTVRLDDGTTLRASVLVACDGRNSPTGARAGIRRTGWSYGQHGMVAAISHERDHGGIAHQLFMPEGPLAILPLRGNRSSIVWSERSERAAVVNALPEDAYLALLRPRFGDFLGEIALEGARYTYPLMLSLANSMIGPRLALVGDAAHRLHPIAGQGLNAGVKDVATLTEVLVEAHRRGENIGNADVLARYERWRRFDVAALAVATDGFNRLFSNDNPLLRLARDVGLAAVNAVPGLRRGFMREAAGLTGDRPRLLAGRPL